MTQLWTLSPDRGFAPDPAHLTIARRLYAMVKDLPIISPHGHVPPALLADPNAGFGSPADLFIIPDHYVTRMLYSQGVSLEALGVPTRDGAPVETDHRAIWQRFADHFHQFRGTPTGLWLADELINVFGVTEKLTSASAQRIYDHLAERLAQPEYTPRALFERFNITVLCTTDAATDPLAHHQALHEQGWADRIRPTFRPDAVVNLQAAGWRDQIARLSEVSGVEIVDVASYIRALEDRRAFFKQMGASAADHAALTPYTGRLERQEAEAIFARALRGQAGADDAAAFMGHM